ncbi:MAG: hypothetical protein AB1767_13505 [Bacillota bacterium]
MHPHYLVSKAARAMPGTHIGVQHHHAHLAFCLADEGYNNPKWLNYLNRSIIRCRLLRVVL